jgi:hypothetical protein
MISGFPDTQIESTEDLGAQLFWAHLQANVTVGKTENNKE